MVVGVPIIACAVSGRRRNMGMDGANSVDAGTGLEIGICWPGNWHLLALKWSESDGRGYAINGSGEVERQERSPWCWCQVLLLLHWRLARAVGGWRLFALRLFCWRRAWHDRLMVGNIRVFVNWDLGSLWDGRWRIVREQWIENECNVIANWNFNFRI